MDIIILGCSYSVPNYFGPPGVDPEHHTEYLLRSAGHRVHNCGQNAGSNMLTLSKAKTYLSGKEIGHPAFNEQRMMHPPADLLPNLFIWFHTEIHRDPWPYSKGVEIIYKAYRDFFHEHGCPYIIIGGAGDLDPSWSDYFVPMYVIPSWRRHILNKDIPSSNTLWSKHAISDNSSLSIEDKIKIIDEDLEIRKNLMDNPDFPDGCHPGIRPHLELTQNILVSLQHDTQWH